MSVPKFDPKELKVVSEIPPFFPGAPSTPVYDFPATPKEAYAAAYKREPIWAISGMESGFFCPSVYPDNVARGLIIEGFPTDPSKFGGKDMFGIEWVFVPTAGGSMVRPGKPFLNNANEWKEKLVWPDIDKWDWEGSAKANEGFLNGVYGKNLVFHWIMNGYFERLISFMDFEGAAVAMIDEDQQDAVKELFQKLTDLYIKVIDKFVQHFHAEAFCVHDDWGSQMAPFFSPAVTAEIIVPAMRRLTDYAHSKGIWMDFHSCGHIEQQVPNMIAAGWDSWSGMPMNDTLGLYKKYGDKILIGLVPPQFAPDTPEAEQRAAAKKFVEEYCSADKPCLVNMYGSAVLTPAYREELYKQSRIKLGGQ
jgi:hypothetical protein